MADVTMTDRDVQDLGAFRYLGSTPGELAKKIADLERDNQKGRDKVKDLEAVAAKVPAEGAVVLTGEDATEYAAWKALGMKAAEAEKLKTDNATLSADKKTRDRLDLLTTAREAEGWNENAPKALTKLAGFDAVDLTQGEVTVERTVAGKKESAKVPTAFVTVDGKPVRIGEWLKSTAPEFVPLLTAQASNGTSGNGAGGVPVPDMRGSAGSGSTTRTEEDHRKAVTSRVDYTV